MKKLPGHGGNDTARPPGRAEVLANQGRRNLVSHVQLNLQRGCFMRYLLGVTMLLGLATAGSVMAQNEPGERAAIRWERAKDAAAAKQARLENPHAKPPEVPKSTVKADSATPHDAARWERAKDAAAAREAAVDTQSGPRTSAVVAKTRKQ